MKRWLSDNAPVIWFVVLVLVVASIGISFDIENRQANKLCQDAGYIGRARIAGQQLCIGYNEGNQMIIIRFEDAKARAGK